jgi:hypothetical protein
MIIGIDASRANRPKKTGVEWYSYHLIQHLKRLSGAANHSWLLYGNTPLTHGLEIGPPAWHEIALTWAPKYLWTQIRLSYEMWRRPPDVLYVSSHVLPRIIPRRSVVVIHAVGSIQADSIRAHNHGLASNNTGSGYANVGGTGAGSNGGAFNTTTSSGNETRPVNAYVNTIIKI